MTRAGALLAFLAAVLAWPAVSRAETGFVNRAIKVNGQARPYQVYVPANWTRHGRWPVILFLHGSGERGDEGLKQTQVGLGAAIRLHADRFPAIVVFPQCPNGPHWTSPGQLDSALAAFQAAAKEFHGDPKRFYLTGLSMGGYGAYALAALHPGFFAAVTSVSGGVSALPGLAIDAAFTAPAGQDPYAGLAAALGDTPVWIFHGAQDPIVPVEDDRKLAALLKAAHPGDRYTEYPSTGHDAWDQAYNDEDWARWLFSQRLP